MHPLVATPLAATPLAPTAPTPFLADTRVLPPKGLNTSWYLDLNHFSRQTAWAHTFMHHYALWLGPVLLVLVFVAAAGVAWWRRAPRAVALLALGGIGTLVALGLNQLVAHAAKELRPYDTHPGVLVLVGKAHDYSFPSDHSVVAGGMTVALLMVLGASVWRRGAAAAGAVDAAAGAVDPAADAADAGGPTTRRGAPGLVRALAAVNVVLGLFLCFARVYVGAHYPGDVVAGYVMTALVVLVVSLLRPVAYRVVDMVEPSPLGALVRRPVAAGAAVPGRLPDPAP